MNSTFTQIKGKFKEKNKMYENLKNLKDFENLKVKIQSCARVDLPKWPGALDHL